MITHFPTWDPLWTAWNIGFNNRAGVIFIISHSQGWIHKQQVANTCSLCVLVTSGLLIFFSLYIFLNFWPHPMACGTLVLWSRMELGSPALKGGVLTTELSGKPWVSIFMNGRPCQLSWLSPGNSTGKQTQCPAAWGMMSEFILEKYWGTAGMAWSWILWLISMSSSFHSNLIS